MKKNALVWTGLGVAFVIVLGAGLSAAAYGYETAYRDRIFGGVSAAGLKLDGLTRAQAREALLAKVDRALEPGFRFRFGEDIIDLPRTTVAVEDPDLSQDLMRYNVDDAVTQAFQLGRGNGMLSDSLTRLRLLLNREDLDLKADVNKPLVSSLLEDALDKHSSIPKDADLVVRYTTGTSALETDVINEQEGRTGDVARAVDILAAQAQRLAFQPISIQTTVIHPAVTSSMVRDLVPQVSSFLGRGTIKLTLDRKTYEVGTSTIAGGV